MRGQKTGRILAVLLVLALVFAGCAAGSGMETGEVVGNREEVVRAVRQGLRDHARDITVQFFSPRDVTDRLTALAGEWMEEAFAETGEPGDGDVLRYQIGGYTADGSAKRVWGGYDCTVVITPKYYMYLWQEEEALAVLGDVTASFGFGEDTPEEEKIRTIYDYVCETVRYDRVHAGNPHHTLRSTLYAGLVWRTATCQGYAATLCRMLREAGVSCRIVDGLARREGEEVYHAWNLVELAGHSYLLDAAWDAGRDVYAYYLRGAEACGDRAPNCPERTEAFLARYPMAEADWLPGTD